MLYTYDSVISLIRLAGIRQFLLQRSLLSFLRPVRIPTRNFFSTTGIRGFVVLLCVCLISITLGAQGDLRSAIKVRGFAIEKMVNSSGDQALEQFIDEHLSPEFRRAFSPQDLLEQLKLVRSRCANAANIMWEWLDENGIRITFQSEEGSSTRVRFRVQLSPPHKIMEMALEEGTGAEKERAPVEPVTWDSLEQRLKEEEQAGFSGVVLVVRDDRIIMHEGYGMANRERSIPNSRKTVFAIGSTPIDFTKAAVLKLEDLGKLRTSDPITKFFSGVPEDKRSITIEHLMTGQSGLPNFHHIPGKDADYDLTWIDRETALNRILGQTLLFPPGQGNKHSHSAWGLLAAIVEIVSGKPYKKFLEEYLFGPAGMDRTGLYQDAACFKEKDVAVGYSPVKVGKINSPQYWGPTSWLVMGSGGMVSNPGDLYKWIQALRRGKLLSREALAKYWSRGILAGGNDRGFLCMYTEGPGSLMILCSNSHTSLHDRAARLGRSLARLVISEKHSPVQEH
jgi:CubicO group peptidase (beta-lactamase class C family)